MARGLKADVVIPMVFPEYRIATAVGRLPWLGHAGVLCMQGETGTTKYYEYGRYDRAALGEVRRRKIPDVVYDRDGRPTRRSLAHVLESISQQAGHGGPILGAYIEAPGKFPAMLLYAQGREKQNSNPRREPYAIAGNSCIHFARAVVVAAGRETPSMIDPRPNSYIDELRDDYPNLDYAVDGALTITYKASESGAVPKWATKSD